MRHGAHIGMRIWCGMDQEHSVHLSASTNSLHFRFHSSPSLRGGLGAQRTMVLLNISQDLATATTPAPGVAIPYWSKRKTVFRTGPSFERVFMRVCDWWRRENELLVENWVFVDVPHVLLQLGYDPLPAWEK